MILEVVSVGLIVSACLAIFFDEAVYSVAWLGTFIFTALLYALSEAPFVAVFQFAIGIGSLSILFLSGEMLSEKPMTKAKPAATIGVTVLGVVLALPAIFFSVSSPNSIVTDVSFGEAMWNLRATDVILQGLVILTLALGIIIVLHSRKRRNNEKLRGGR